MKLYIILISGIFIFAEGCGTRQEISMQPKEIFPSVSNVSTQTSETSLSPAYGDSLIEIYLSDAVTLNPVLIADVPSRRISQLIFGSLVKESPYYDILPDLAETWETRADGRAITFHLRDGVKWQDGVPFSADDVKFTYEKIMDPKTQTYVRDDFTLVSTVEVLDRLTLRVEYSEPFAPALCGWTIGIIPKHLYASEEINSCRYNRAPIGTGPFRFVEWKPQEQIILEGNQDYFGGRPYLNRYICKNIPDPSMAFLCLLRGEADMMELTPDQYVKKANTGDFLSRFNVYRYPSTLYTYLGFNLTNPLFSDKSVRQALTMAADRQAIIDNVLYGMGMVLSGPFPPSFWAYDNTVKPLPFDIEKSRALLSEAGWKDLDGDGILERGGKKFDFELVTNNGNEMRRLAASLIRDDWKKIGVNVRLKFVEWGVLMDVCDYKSFDALIMGWSHRTDPDPFSRFHSSVIPDKARGFVADNFCSYINPAADKLMVEGRTTFELEKRRKIYHEFHRIISEDQPYVFLFSQDTIIAVSNRVMGIEVAPAGIRYNIQGWYVPKQFQKY
ncbi:MAG: peptide-binding protein [Candidatus Wallbacteria bacterium]|nr:peptide-binding protein [Candidatus Wallbacteria bacterium]